MKGLEEGGNDSDGRERERGREERERNVKCVVF